MVTVTFIKSPSGKPWFLAYSAGDQGLVSPQKAASLLEHGMIKPIEIANEVADASTFTTVERIKAAVVMSEDLTTVLGVKTKFGDDIEAMKQYCDENKIRYSKGEKRPESFWTKIAKHENK